MTARLQAQLKELIRRTSSKLGFQIKIQRFQNGKPNPIHLWNEDKQFNDLMKQLAGYTVVDKSRCFMIYQYARHAKNLSGDIAEVGVYKGGTARLLAKTLEKTGKTIHLFDTFSGMPQTDPDKDIHKKGDFNDASLENVKKYLYDCNNISFYKGLFPDTAKPAESITFSMVHIDVDIYKSITDCCNFFYQRMVKGGIMIFDDYGILSCPGAKTGVDDFFSDKPENPCYLPTGQCTVFKL
ncbi:MAG: class I SAM-dependent methyltransferase [Elusimicrobia bacterium]|nr:class I SAM-dependent methyltransferase [Elusimicrobiota bacterium]